jgi:hypothetical protein
MKMQVLYKAMILIHSRLFSNSPEKNGLNKIWVTIALIALEHIIDKKPQTT